MYSQFNINRMIEQTMDTARRNEESVDNWLRAVKEYKGYSNKIKEVDSK